MSYETVCDQKDRDAWLRERKRGLGGSDAAAILGLYPWKTPLEVYAEKIGHSNGFRENDAARFGTILEPHVIDRFAEATQRTVGIHGELLRSAQRPWQLATLDGSQAETQGQSGPGLLEIKCTSLKDRWSDGPPPYVLAQVQHQLSVTGWTWGSIAALFNATEFQWWDISRDEAFITELNQCEEEFWQRVITGRPPEPEGTYGDRQALQLLFPKQSPGSVIELATEFVPLIERFEALKAEKTALEEKLLAVQNTIVAAIGSAETAKLPNGQTYTYKHQHRGAYTVEAQDFRVLRSVKNRSST